MALAKGTSSKSGSRSFPDFFIIGAQKGGTTALYTYLAAHPDIAACDEKELHYFGCPRRYALGAEYYRSLFPKREGNKLLLDASPSYLHNPDCATRIARHHPEARFIVLLRDPVERAYSAWNMYRTRFRKNRDWFYDDWLKFCGQPEHLFIRRADHKLSDFTQYILDEIEHEALEQCVRLEAPVLSLGCYAEQMRKYWALFPRKNMLVLDSAALPEDVVRWLKRVERFLGIQEFDWSSAQLGRIFQGAYVGEMNPTARGILEEYYRSKNRDLFDGLGHSFAWSG